MRAWRLLIVLLALTGTTAACTIGPSARPEVVTSGAAAPTTATVTSASPMPTGPGGPGRQSSPIDWTDCPADIDPRDPVSGRSFILQCADVRVPRNYQANGEARYSIAVTRARAPNAPDEAPALITVLGGPAENGTGRAAAVAGSLPAAITDHFAVVVLDLRGTGSSGAVDCVSRTSAQDLLSLGPDPSSPGAADLIAQLSRTLTFDCGDEAGTGLSSFSTVPASDDLDTIRAALGTATLNFLGRGFGATLGAVYADRYPGRVARMVLDSPTDPLLAADKRALATAQAAEAALDAFSAACPTFAGGCPLGGQPRAAVIAAVDHLGDTGISDDSGQLVSGGSALLTLLLLLGTPASWPDLATAFADAAKDNTDALGQLLVRATGGDERASLLAGAIIYGCNDTAQRLVGDPLTRAVAAAKQAAPVFGPFAVSLVALCGSWPAPDAALGGVSGRGAAPILVVGAIDDPVTAFSGVRSLSGQLSSAVLLSWQSGVHGSYPSSACVTTAVDSYLLKGAVPAAGVLCPP